MHAYSSHSKVFLELFSPVVHTSKITPEPLIYKENVFVDLFFS